MDKQHPGGADNDFESGDQSERDRQSASSGGVASTAAGRDGTQGAVAQTRAGDPQQVPQELLELLTGSVGPQVAQILVQQSRSWSGMLPSPEDFAAYPKSVQERMLAWNDASTVDESRRLNRLVDHEIKIAHRGQWMAAAFALALFALAGWLANAGNNVGAAIVASPAVLVLIREMLPPQRQRRGEGKEDQK